MTTPLDSAIFAPLFTDEEVSANLSDSAYVRSLVEVEAALARAEGRLEVIPLPAADEIGKISAEKIGITALTNGTLQSGFPIIALVQEIRKLVSPEAAPYVHWGATTQDIMDTACVLQLRSIGKLFRARLVGLVQSLSELSNRHRKTVMAARTHGQQAVPLSFGLKVAMWLAPLIRHVERFDEIAPRLLVVQFGAAAGTLAALGDKGLGVVEALAQELGLSTPAMPWHAQRDNYVEFASWLSLVTGSLGKMAQDVILMAQSEVGEVGESAEKGRGGSSTMPQKTNPITSELIMAAARTNASLLSALHQALIQEHERATHGWQVEWLTLPQMVSLTGGALKHALYLAKNLQIDPVRMRSNMARAHDVVLAEAAAFALALTLPRPKADELVKNACAIAVAKNEPLIETIKSLAAGALPDGAVDWQSLAQPENYLGESEKMIDQVLKKASKCVP